MQMDDVEALAREQVSQPKRRAKVESISNRERMADHALGPRALPEPSARIADQLGAMAPAPKLARQAQDLGLAAGKAKLRIDARDSERPQRRTFYG
jgi:hypothetical protein